MEVSIEKLSKFERVIPKEGICIYPGIWYHDVNDIPRGLRISTKEFFFQDQDYMKLIERPWKPPTGNIKGKRYCVYHFLKGEVIGNSVFTEYLDSPDGYGAGDFYFHKWIFPRFRFTKFSRFITSDMMHMLFYSGAAENLYCYMAMTDKKEDPVSIRAMQYPSPCRGKIYDTDGPSVQKYIVWRHVVSHEGCPDFVLMELCGNLYKELDLKSYLMAPPHRKEETVKRWLKEMSDAANKVKESIKEE